MILAYNDETHVYTCFKDGKILAQFTKELVVELKMLHGLNAPRELYNAICETYNIEQNRTDYKDFKHLEDLLK